MLDYLGCLGTRGVVRVVRVIKFTRVIRNSRVVQAIGLFMVLWLVGCMHSCKRLIPWKIVGIYVRGPLCSYSVNDHGCLQVALLE